MDVLYHEYGAMRLEVLCRAMLGMALVIIAVLITFKAINFAYQHSLGQMDPAIDDRLATYLLLLPLVYVSLAFVFLANRETMQLAAIKSNEIREALTKADLTGVANRVESWDDFNGKHLHTLIGLLWGLPLFAPILVLPVTALVTTRVRLKLWQWLLLLTDLGLFLLVTKLALGK